LIRYINYNFPSVGRAENFESAEPDLTDMELNKSLIQEIKLMILQSRETAIRAVDHARVLMYWILVSVF